MSLLTSPVVAGRMTAVSEGEVTVFLIGMRVNRPLRVDKWAPVAAAMPRMLVHLAKDPETGFLGQHSWFGRTTILLSYWRSPEHLNRFAADASAPHLAAWRAFRKAIGDDGSVGIWHETYVVPASAREVVYGNMPTFGLAKAIGSVPVGPGLHTARQRLATGATADSPPETGAVTA